MGKGVQDADKLALFPSDLALAHAVLSLPLVVQPLHRARLSGFLRQHQHPTVLQALDELADVLRACCFLSHKVHRPVRHDAIALGPRGKCVGCCEADGGRQALARDGVHVL
eukprot:2447464-Rhodomonas_salina.1